MKRWYVAHVYAGFEEAVKKDLEKRVAHEGMSEVIEQILVPSAKVKDFSGSPDTQDRQLFPGYVLLEMEMTPETSRLVTSTPRVLKFLGGNDPAPLSVKEVERFWSQVKGELVVKADKSEFVVGSEVDITDGPFAGFVGRIEGLDEESEKLTVMVSIFGRLTPVELRFDQVKQ